jgi:excinuclease UvrABC helicase subunit UvrB
MNEKKYFISYAAYYKPEGKYDIFNDIIYIDNEITSNAIQKNTK